MVGAEWDEKIDQWHVKAKDLVTGAIKTASAHVLINDGGILNSWRFPPIPGIKDFKGKLVHSAAWPERLNLSGKIAGLIGNGYFRFHLAHILRPAHC